MNSLFGMAKADGSLRSYRGREDNFDKFWQKFQVVGKIQKWSDGAARMAHLPLYLTADAFSVWSEMSDADKADKDMVHAQLQKSFSMLPGEAYSQYVRRRKRDDESVETYLADLRRLMRISGHKEKADGKDPMLLEQFLVGLPSRFADQLRLSIAAVDRPSLMWLLKLGRCVPAPADSRNC